MPKLLSILSPLLALAGCGGECVPVDLTPDERIWVSAYQAGQQVTFRSNRGATNVLTALPLKEWHDNQNCNTFEAGKFQPIRTTMGLTSATSYGSADHPSFSLLAYKIQPNIPAQLNFDLAGLVQDSDPPGSPRPKLVKLVAQPVTLANGRSYPAAQLIRTGQHSALYLRGSQLRAAWWDQHAGLVRYELETGEVFDLVAP